jgi:hypothetical protein
MQDSEIPRRRKQAGHCLTHVTHVNIQRRIASYSAAMNAESKDPDPSDRVFPSSFRYGKIKIRIKTASYVFATR